MSWSDKPAMCDQKSDIKNVQNKICNGDQERVYTYTEAINLAGNGWYSWGLLITLSTCVLAMAVDMFGFSVVVNAATCDFDLDITQTSILLSMAFAGPIVMAYPWGYISDTQGRRRSILISMWVSFMVSTLAAFSPNWVVMAVLKFISTSFCSCAQAASFTLLGESCSERVRDPYMLVISSVLDFSLAFYIGISYVILNVNFSYDLGFITFTPWRLLTLALALPLGVGALGTHFFYESPKFLINAGRHEEAVYCLRRIWKRNNGKGNKYPAKNIILNEAGNERRKDVTLLRSLWDQIVPLFKPPLLKRSLQLYFCTAVVFSTNNSYFIWFPYLAEKFATGLDTLHEGDEQGICNIIVNNKNSTSGAAVCTSKMELNLFWSSLIQGASFVFLMLIIMRLVFRKKLLQITILTVAALCAVGAGLIKNNLISAIMFLGLLANEMCIGIIYTYIVDLYPTSHRGMATCICAMVARLSALVGVNVLGAFMLTKCTEIFYICGGLMFCDGWYSWGLLGALSVSTLAMAVDMFGFSVIVNAAACEFDLDIRQTSILLSMSFIGPIAMAYPWGYISDTQGRRKSILIAMWVSFVVSTAGAFSPNWIVMAALKFISTSFCSCAHSASFTLLGESCAERSRDAYMLIMTSVLDFSLAFYVAVSYFILNMDFIFNWGFITFTPWRLLALGLALPLGLGALGTHFFYESPKFLINAGRHEEALYCLRRIWRRNSGEGEKYPVKNIVLDEEGNDRRTDVSFLRSLWDQIVPLFKPPLLWRSLQLYFCLGVVFGTNNSYFIWFPYLAEKFMTGLDSGINDDEKGVCNIILSNQNDTYTATVCTSKVEISLFWASLLQGASFVVLMLIVMKLASRKKLLQITILSVAGISAVGAGVIRDNMISAVMFLCFLANELCIGIVYTYIVDLYPTSYRGMASCLSVIVARLSALACVNILGAFVLTNCTEMFYVCGGLMFIAAMLSLMLPPDRMRKT